MFNNQICRHAELIIEKEKKIIIIGKTGLLGGM